MEMNFPHSKLRSGVYITSPEYGAYLAKATVRQGNSPTAQAMLNAALMHEAQSNEFDHTLSSRMRYFAAAYFPNSAEAAPYGAFVPSNNREFSNSANYDQAVYQDGLDDGKLDAVFDVDCNLTITQSGQEN